MSNVGRKGVSHHLQSVFGAGLKKQHGFLELIQWTSDQVKGLSFLPGSCVGFQGHGGCVCYNFGKLINHQQSIPLLKSGKRKRFVLT